MEASLQGYKQLTDAYLLALAHQRKGALATFDRGLRTLAGDAFRSSLEIVPTK
jgi:predicted nucleic acid-binding protein